MDWAMQAGRWTGLSRGFRFSDPGEFVEVVGGYFSVFHLRDGDGLARK